MKHSALLAVTLAALITFVVAAPYALNELLPPHFWETHPAVRIASISLAVLMIIKGLTLKR